MKNKIISLFIILLIIAILMPMNIIYAENLETLEAQEIVELYYEQGLSNINTHILEIWVNTINDYRGRKTQTMIEVRDEIKKEINRRVLLNDPEYWKPTLNSDNNKLIEIVGKVLGVIQVVGSVVSVIALSVIGIKYMVGSVEEKAKYKETMTAYIIGCVLLFAISNITSIIYQVSNNIFK